MDNAPLCDVILTNGLSNTIFYLQVEKWIQSRIKKKLERDEVCTTCRRSGVVDVVTLALSYPYLPVEDKELLRSAAALKVRTLY